MKPFNENRFDEVFRSKLGNFSEMPPDQVLGNIKKTMSQGPVPGSSWFGKYWMFFAVTGITGLVVLSLSLMSADDKVQTAMNQNTEIATPENTSIPAVSEEKNIVAEQKVVINTEETVSNESSSVYTTNVSEIFEVNNLTATIDPQNNEKSAVVNLTPNKLEDININTQVTPSTCRKANGSISLSAPGGQRYYYYWSDLSQTNSYPVRNNLMANTYTVRVVAEDGSHKNYDIVVGDTGTVASQFSHYEVSPTAGIPVYFDNKSRYCGHTWENNGIVSFLWYFGDGNTSYSNEPEHIYNTEGSYIVSLVSTSIMGCKDSVALLYLNITGSEMDVPNVITPNNDGMNDYFKPEITGMVEHKCEIFSRLGEKVYEWQGMEGQWDGKIKNSNNDAAAGVYYYIIEGKGSDGRQFIKKGFVQLIR